MFCLLAYIFLYCMKKTTSWPLFHLTLLQHLRTQYDELFPRLCNDYPDIFPPKFYTWEQFLWACELFYSNSMKIIFADGKLRTCLIPIAGFLNHSVFHSSFLLRLVLCTLLCPVWKSEVIFLIKFWHLPSNYEQSEVLQFRLQVDALCWIILIFSPLTKAYRPCASFWLLQSFELF